MICVKQGTCTVAYHMYTRVSYIHVNVCCVYIYVKLHMYAYVMYAYLFMYVQYAVCGRAAVYIFFFEQQYYST